MFKLDKKLANDCFEIKDLKLSKLLLMNNKKFLWLILVPKKENLVEIIDLDYKNQLILLEEINLVSRIIKNLFSPDKLNIANLGNQVSQLHIHIIARYKNDEAFPNPVWGFGSKKYDEEEAKNIINKIKNYVDQK